ncbi:MAG: MBL fold metallo-hydrolase [Solirubrobacteraceae bacterium]
MVFSLEALQAFQGDSLLLHAGDRLCLIDGGPRSTWETSLRPRLEQLRAARAPGGGPLRIDLAMVSHIDDDHIHGLTDLGGAMVELADDHQPQPYELGGLWHNAFDDVLGNRDQELADAGAPVVASVGQGRVLRDQSVRLGWPRNEPFGGLVVAPREVPFGDATLTVVAPAAPALADLDAKWEEVVSKQAAKTHVTEYADRSVFNLSSIVVLAEADGKSMLLCGDARGDHVLGGLETAGRLPAGGALALDVLKLPHHGSIRNVEADFFTRLPARHYVISANGRDGNPESATLQAIADSRADDDFTIHLTNHDGQDDLAARLDAFVAARDAAGRAYGIEFRDTAALSLRIDLADPPEEP